MKKAKVILGVIVILGSLSIPFIIEHYLDQKDCSFDGETIPEE